MNKIHKTDFFKILDTKIPFEILQMKENIKQLKNSRVCNIQYNWIQEYEKQENFIERLEKVGLR
ncbi:MAG: hypothetical protein ACXAC7_11460 [Candidatus Hodarchaeales archaeon]